MSAADALPLRAMVTASLVSVLCVIGIVMGLRLAFPEPASEPDGAAVTAPVPTTAAGWLTVGLDQYRAGDLEAAEASFAQAATLDPDDAVAVFNVGTVRDARGDLAGAREQYARAVQLDPGFVDAHFNLAVALAALGDTDGAIAAYRDVLDLEAGRAAALWNLGLLLYEDGRQREGRQLLSRAIAIDPTFEERLPETVDLR